MGGCEFTDDINNVTKIIGVVKIMGTGVERRRDYRKKLVFSSPSDSLLFQYWREERRGMKE